MTKKTKLLGKANETPEVLREIAAIELGTPTYQVYEFRQALDPINASAEEYHAFVAGWWDGMSAELPGDAKVTQIRYNLAPEWFYAGGLGAMIKHHYIADRGRVVAQRANARRSKTRQ
jgi:hypothetical protein